MLRHSSAPLRLRALSIAALLLSLLSQSFSGQSQSQQSKQANEPEEGTVKLEATEVSLPVSVRNRNTGALVGNLKISDFIVYEDNVQQEISFFTATRVPVNVVLLIDVSSSLRSEIENIKAAALNFIRELGDNDKVSIMAFSDTVELIQDWTSDKSALESALLRIRRGEHTAFNDALFLAAEEQLMGVKGRKAIIILSDGVDNQASQLSFEQAFDALMHSEATVYVVSKTAILSSRINDELRMREKALIGQASQRESEYISDLKLALKILGDSEKRLTRIVEETGGRIYLPMSQRDLLGAYSEVATEIKSQYIINYIPSNTARDGRFRRVRVKCTNPNYRTYSRGGYYAPKDAPDEATTGPRLIRRDQD